MSFPASPTIGQTTVTNNITYIYNTGTNGVGYWTRQAATITSGSGGTAASGTGTTTTFIISNITSSTNTGTGALQVYGGVGVWGNVNIGGGIRTTNITATSVTIAGVAASSTVTGALQVIGGVGVNGNLYAGNIYTNNAQILPTSIQEFVSVQGQTIYSVSGGFAAGQVLVFANGLGLSSADYTAATPVITLNTQRNAGDIIKVVVGQQFAVPITQVSAAAAMAMVLGI
jgi:hypothetical protein